MPDMQDRELYRQTSLINTRCLRCPSPIGLLLGAHALIAPVQQSVGVKLCVSRLHFVSASNDRTVMQESNQISNRAQQDPLPANRFGAEFVTSIRTCPGPMANKLMP
jgi:hypothetical protein